jgi:putative hydrolase of the HAD superfamily
MTLKCLLFDLYGTVIDVETDESMIEIYRAIAHFLVHHGVDIHRFELRDLYGEIMKHQRRASTETHPEIDVVAIWRELLAHRQARSIEPDVSREALARTLAQLHRAISRNRLALYPDVARVLDEWRARLPLGLVSDAQPCFTAGEIAAVGLGGYFRTVVMSGAQGYRKPDRRMYQVALDALEATPGEAIFIGNDMFRDIYGAREAGLRTIFFASNQGTQTHEGTIPDYVARSWQDVRRGIEFLERR